MTRLRRSTNTKGAAREGTCSTQRESLMLSRCTALESDLENHFPSLADGAFGVSTSRPCALHFPSPFAVLPRHPLPHSRQAALIQREEN